MTAPIPPQLEGSQTPTSLEFLWDRHRRTIFTIGVAAVFALGLNYGIRYYVQTQTNQKWAAFTDATGLRGTYVSEPEQMRPSTIVDALEASGKEVAAAAATADTEQRPFILWAAASQQLILGKLDEAERLLAELERDYPRHTLCLESSFPVQYREPVKSAEGAKPDPRGRQKLTDPEEGSMVGRMRKQIAAIRGYEPPPHFAKQAIPEDAPRVKVTFEGEVGNFVIALLPEKAPDHVKEFLSLVDEGFWNGQRIDEIVRTGTRSPAFKTPTEFHFGLEASREEDKALWITKDPSKHQVAFETNDLSHFPGAVAARMENDGKMSSADRIWICVDDVVQKDGQRVVFGYVVEGLETLERVGGAGFGEQGEDENGRGKPSPNITIASVQRV